MYLHVFHETDKGQVQKVSKSDS